MATAVKTIKPARKTSNAARSMTLTKKERDRVIAKAKAFARRNGGQKKLIPLLGTSDGFMTPEELRAFRDLK